MLNLAGISKQFANGFIALDGISCVVEKGEIVSIVGTSGCGKSTLLRIIAGLEAPTLGTISINHYPITSPHPEVGIIFQEPRLMPWLSVCENVQFGLEGFPKAEKAQLTQVILERVGLADFAHALPRQLSGGMSQRVAIARALITKPSILLLDEPFSALDAFIRIKLQDHLLDVWQYDRPTLILVTHDIEEALVLSDQVIVLRGSPGRVHQEFVLDLPRPRKRTDLRFQYWKEQLFNALDLTVDDPCSSLS